MLGFDALGRLALGQVTSAATSQPLSANISAMAKLRVQGSPTFALQAKIDASAFLKAQMAPTSAISARSKSMLSMRIPGGFGLSSRVTGMAKARATPGYLLFARAMMASSALPNIHVERSGPPSNRDPLLLNPESQYGASYWRGRG